jgi:hypothetical protein
MSKSPSDHVAPLHLCALFSTLLVRPRGAALESAEIRSVTGLEVARWNRLGGCMIIQS